MDVFCQLLMFSEDGFAVQAVVLALIMSLQSVTFFIQLWPQVRCMMLMNNVVSSMEQHPANANMGKCVESSGASAKATAVSPTVFQLLRGHCVRLGILRKGGVIREIVFLLAHGPRVLMGAGVPGHCGASAAGPAEEVSPRP